MHNLLIVAGQRSGGGGERVRELWTQELRRLGHQVTEVFLDELPAGGNPIARFATLTRAIRRQVRLVGPDVVVGVQTYPNLLCLVAARGTTVIATEHSLLTDLLRSEGVEGWVKRMLVRRLYSRARRVTTPSAAACASLRAALPSSRFPEIRIVPNPVAPSEPHVRRAAPPDDAGVLWIGRFVAEKRPELFLDMVELLRKQEPSTPVTMLGDGPLLEGLTGRAAALDVHLPGWVESTDEAILAAGVVVSTSSIEGFGNVVAEAAGAGVPVVVTDDALGPADLLLPGVTGESVPATPAHLVDAVQRMRRHVIAPDVAAAVRKHWSPLHSVGLLLDGIDLS